MARKVERITGTFHGFPAEIVYSPGVREMVMWLNFDGQSCGSEGQPFEHGHRTFTGVSVEQWDAIKSHLTTACSRPPIMPSQVVIEQTINK